MRTPKKGFTLIELMVVVTIIGMLIAIVLPSLGRARTQARRAACAGHLHQIGVAMIAYMQDSRDRMPHASFMPSISPFPLDTDEPIHIADVLAGQTKGQDKVFQCPEDFPGRTPRNAPNAGLSYFQTERSSYEYRFSLAGLTPMEFDNRSMRRGGRGVRRRGPTANRNRDAPPESFWVMRDYANFHGKAGGGRRYLYIDGRVGEFEN